VPPAPQASFALGFEGCPAEVTGSTVGEAKTFEVNATLTTSNNATGTKGAAAWSIGVGAENLTIVSIAIEGTDAEPALIGGMNSSQVVDPALDLGSGPQGQGAVSAVILASTEYIMLPPEGTARIARITVKATIPEAASSGRLFFVDGLKGGGRPVENVVALENASHFPSLGSCTIDLRRTAGGLMRPGDANGDGGLDISDAVATLGVLFLGSAEGFPCGDRSATDLGNVSLLDWQPDDTVDISDAVAMLSFLFTGGGPHTLAPEANAKGCIRIAGCSDFCGQ